MTENRIFTVIGRAGRKIGEVERAFDATGSGERLRLKVRPDWFAWSNEGRRLGAFRSRKAAIAAVSAEEQKAIRQAFA